MKSILIALITVGLTLNGYVASADEIVSGGGGTANACETQINCTVQTGNQTVTTQTNVPAGSVSNLPMSGNTTQTTMLGAGAAGALGAGGSGAYAQAMAAQQQAQQTAMMAAMMAAMFASQCRPTNPMPCMLAGVAAGAAMMAMGKAGEAGNLMNQLGSAGVPTVPQDPAIQGTTDTNIEGQLDQVQSDLAANGYNLNKDGSLKLPNGKSIDGSMNAENMGNAAGLNTADTQALASSLDRMKDDLASKSALAGSGDGSGAGGAGAGSGAMSGAYGSTGETGRGLASAGSDKTGIDKDPKAWEGFYKQYGDSKIGVAQTDIFLMVEKRVETERKIMGH